VDTTNRARIPVGRSHYDSSGAARPAIRRLSAPAPEWRPYKASGLFSDRGSCCIRPDVALVLGSGGFWFQSPLLAPSAPADVTLVFVPSGASVTAASDLALTVYGTTLGLHWNNAAPQYFPALQQIVVPFTSSLAAFLAPAAANSRLTEEFQLWQKAAPSTLQPQAGGASRPRWKRFFPGSACRSIHRSVYSPSRSCRKSAAAAIRWAAISDIRRHAP
jgi:hypothetical protein